MEWIITYAIFGGMDIQPGYLLGSHWATGFFTHTHINASILHTCIYMCKSTVDLGEVLFAGCHSDVWFVA